MTSLRHIASTSSSCFKCSTSSSSRSSLSTMRCKAVAVATAEVPPSSSSETSAHQSAPSSGGKKNDALARALTSSPELSTLVSAVSRAELLESVTSLESGTIFAPTNEAFEEFGRKKGLSSEQIFQRENLAEILTYHVIPSAAMSSAEVMSSDELETLNSGKVLTVK